MRRNAWAPCGTRRARRWANANSIRRRPMHDNGSRQFESGELSVPLSETQELELASELLEVASEQELEQFLGDVFHGVGNALGQFVRSDTAQALGAVLKDA